MAVDGEVVKPTRRKKHHVDLSQDDQVKGLLTKYEGTEGQRALAKIDPQDIENILSRYEQDQLMDLYTIAESFHVSSHALYNALKSEKYAERYQAAKRRRGEMLVQKALDVSGSPWYKIQAGEEVSMVEVAAAKLYANSTMYAGKCLNPEYNPQKEAQNEGGINVIVNTGIKLNI